MGYNTMNATYTIFEMANAHSGSKDMVLQTLQALKDMPSKRVGVKFQPFHPDGMALPDYPYYKVYRKLFFELADWREIIQDARQCCGDVWLDIFDTYSVEVLQDNWTTVRGVKLQASVLDNLEVFALLKKHSWAGKNVILNVSGQELGQIRSVLDRFAALTIENPIILQVGYQRYPAQPEDTPFGKITTIKSAFPDNPVSFADHLDGKSAMAMRVPLLAAILGCAYIEKHVCHRRADAEYDHHSALEPEEMRELVAELESLRLLDWQSFISDAERAYFTETQQVPVAKRALHGGSLVSVGDLAYRRTTVPGLTWTELSGWQARHRMILAADVPALSPVRVRDMKPARVGVIVACRMKSSRLPQKAILPIAGIPSVERCLRNCRMFRGVDMVVLATSTLDEDAVLQHYAGTASVKFWRGDPEDVIQRYVGACDAYGIDVIVRVTADCPVISPEIGEYLLDAHFKSGADYTAAVACSVGTGSEVYNAESLRRVLRYKGRASHSEYMTWYLRNNPDIFRVNQVDLPEALVRDYRLTLDYPEDLAMFEALYAKLEAEGLDTRVPNVFSILDRHPQIAAMNQHLPLAYRTDPALIAMLNRETKITVPDATPVC